MNSRPEGGVSCASALTVTTVPPPARVSAAEDPEPAVGVVEITDPDGDALTVTMDAQGAWVTCTSVEDEVTFGPFPGASLVEALRMLVTAPSLA